MKHLKANIYLDLENRCALRFFSLRVIAQGESIWEEVKAMSGNSQSTNDNEEAGFAEFRRKVRSAEVLSPAVEKLLRSLHFTGRVSVIIQNGRVLKSGYEEGYFRQRETPPI